MNEKNSSPIYLISAILFAVMAIISLVNGINLLTWGWFAILGVMSLLTMLGYGFMSAILFTRKRDILLLISTGVICFINFLTLILVSYGAASIIGNLFIFLGSLAMLAIAAIVTLEQFAKYRNMIKQLWFVPAIAIGLGGMISLITYFMFGTFCSVLLEIAAYLLLGMWLVYPDGLGNSQASDNGTAPCCAGNTADNNSNNNNNCAGNTAPQRDGYCKMIKHVLLLFFTFGIWYLIWIYRTTDYLNRVPNEPYRNPTTKLLLCIFVPFYIIYWIYKSAQLIDKLAGYYNIHSDIDTLCLILEIFVGIVPPIIMQDKINEIATAEHNGVPQTAPQSFNQNYYQQPAASPQSYQQPAPAPAPAQDSAAGGGLTPAIAQELKTYKELLDSNVITQEEFEIKKKQLLGL